MSEMISEQARRTVQEHAIKEAAILESIPTLRARLESLRTVYSPGGDASRQYAQLKETLRQLTVERGQLEARSIEIIADIAAAQERFEAICTQVGTLNESSVVINEDSVKEDVFEATKQLGKLRKLRESIAASLDQCADDMSGAQSALDKLSRQRQVKVSAALLLAARLNEALESIEDVNDISYQPAVDPSLPVDEYTARVQEQPRNASTINWASGIFDVAMQQVEEKRDKELREAAEATAHLQDDGSVGRSEGMLSEEVKLSPGMLAMLRGEGE